MSRVARKRVITHPTPNNACARGAPGFDRQPNVINGFSDLILELYGPEVGNHARSAVGMAVGMAGLPLGMPVEIEAKIELRIT